ncbi:family S9 non-peptidase homologue (S09 family) [Schistosoma mansoni]|uniref:Family S9 non-peptidase homologue (S09 family) n=1 Tax=Schistosoma mansoni TaxID=6183 RepID=G4VH14_SCHMA|nr:family S9 non-peptidase homologue (S09 family) [Schistosoma mansoni]|eukprot:XP_018650899.1 family S9 non-peptidase homologue (S09 family) [Schistosoma mansoni]
MGIIDEGLPEIVDELDYQYRTANWLIKTREPFCLGDDVRGQLLSLLRKQSEFSRTQFKDKGVFKVPFVGSMVFEDGYGDYVLDWFPPSDQSIIPTNIVVYIHGGYWQLVGWGESSNWAVPVTNADSIFVSLSYRLAPKEKLEAMSQSLCLGMQKVMTLTHKMFGNLDDTKLRITLFGHSAGAHLVLEMIYWAHMDLESNNNWLCCLRNLVLMSGVYDLRPIIHTYVNKAIKFKTIEEALSVSPIRHFMQDGLNLLLSKSLHWIVAWAEYESPAMKGQSKSLADLLSKASNRSGQGSPLQFTYETFYMSNEDHFTSLLGLHDGPNHSAILKKIIDLINLKPI